MSTRLKIGDEVRLSNSSLEMSGEITAFRDPEYVIVRWFGSRHSTHHVASLERVVTKKPEMQLVSSVDRFDLQ